MGANLEGPPAGRTRRSLRTAAAPAGARPAGAPIPPASVPADSSRPRPEEEGRHMKRRHASVLAPLEERLNCHGFFGFGGGYELGISRAKAAPQGEIYCNRTCSMSASCWNRHRERIQILFPELTAEMDRI